MAITYAQASNPYWYFVDLTGKPAGSGQVFFYSSSNPDILKPVFQDPAGLIPYPNPGVLPAPASGYSFRVVY